MKSKYWIISIAVLTFCLTVPAAGLAEEMSSATAGVYVIVDPNVGVMPKEANVDAGSVQVSDFKALISFRVDANTQKVKMNAAVTNLYKGDDPTDPEVPPILVNPDAGVTFSIQDGSPINGGNGNVGYIGAAPDIGLYPALQTGDVVFESSQNGHLSQDVTLEVTWTQDDPEKPRGEYSGKVKLSCMVVI